MAFLPEIRLKPGGFEPVAELRHLAPGIRWNVADGESEGAASGGCLQSPGSSAGLQDLPPSSPAWSANIAFRGSFWPSASCVAPIIAEFGELDPMSPELTSAIRLRRITVRCQDGETLRIKHLTPMFHGRDHWKFWGRNTHSGRVQRTVTYYVPRTRVEGLAGAMAHGPLSPEQMTAIRELLGRM